MFQLNKAGCLHEVPPAFVVVINAVAVAVPAFFVGAARVGAEQDAAWLECGVQLAKNAWERLARNVEERGIGKHAVKTALRQIEAKKTLLPHLALAFATRHVYEAFGAVESDRLMPASNERPEIAPGTAAEIEDGERRFSGNVPQQRVDVLADVVVARAVPIRFGALVVVTERQGGDLVEIVETRPVSRTKTWAVTSVLEKAVVV